MIFVQSLLKETKGVVIMADPDYLIKIKIGEKLKTVGSGFKQENGAIRLQLSAVPLDQMLWLFPFERR